VNSIASRPVVVGVDGSDASVATLDWALTEARVLRVPLRIVHAVQWPLLPLPPRSYPLGTGDDTARTAGERVLAEAACRCVTAAPDVTVEIELVIADPTGALLQQSASTSLVVVGATGAGELTGVVLGSVADVVATKARCPAVVVRRPSAADGPVVVGIDGSPGADTAFDFALQHADRRRVPLIAMYAWHGVASYGPGVMLPLVVDWELVAEEARRGLAEAIAGWSEKYPDVTVEQRVVRAHPVQALADAGRFAQLLVVGSRGHGGYVGLLLGSVAQGLVHHGPCPVAVVHQGALR
jgi:nucleotide-binding universal stress UspA family protein